MEELEVGPEEEELEAEVEFLGEEKTTSSTLAALLGAPQHHPFRVRVVLKGQKVILLIYSGATHNFINESLVRRRGVHAKELQGFDATMVDGNTIPCTRRVKGLDITLGSYNMSGDFFLTDIGETSPVLGVPWLHSLGEIS